MRGHLLVPGYAIGLRACYTLSGTKVAYGARCGCWTHTRVQSSTQTGTTISASVLRDARDVKHDMDMHSHGVFRWESSQKTSQDSAKLLNEISQIPAKVSPLPGSQDPQARLAQRQSRSLSSYALPMLCPCMLLRAPYAVSGTDIAYVPKRSLCCVRY
eukprot:2625224-Rhodomonas_salina.2